MGFQYICWRPDNEIAGLCGNFVLNFLKNCQTFSKVCSHHLNISIDNVLKTPVSPQNVLYFLIEKHLHCRKNRQSYVYYLKKNYHCIRNIGNVKIKPFKMKPFDVYLSLTVQFAIYLFANMKNENPASKSDKKKFYSTGKCLISGPRSQSSWVAGSQ